MMVLANQKLKKNEDMISCTIKKILVINWIKSQGLKQKSS